MTDIGHGAARRLPGLPGFWVLIGGDMALFSLLFFAFLNERAAAVPQFRTERGMLDADHGGINTLLLLTSSWCVARAMVAARAGDRGASAWLGGAAAGGGAFVVSKAGEYLSVVRGGHVPASSEFFAYYFTVTGLHLAHVVAGLVLILICAVRWRRTGPSAGPGFESVACYWHLIDFLWIVIFALLYLLP